MICLFIVNLIQHNLTYLKIEECLGYYMRY